MTHPSHGTVPSVNTVFAILARPCAASADGIRSGSAPDTLIDRVSSRAALAAPPHRSIGA